MLPTPRRRNRRGYRGETLEISGFLSQAIEAAGRLGWGIQELISEPGESLLALHRSFGGSLRRRVYLSAGIHGDEPAGPLAALELLKRYPWHEVDVWICPCLNPSGFRSGARENAAGMDLNRDYRTARAPEVKAHVRWLETLPSLDVTVCLHEDWEAKGFYIYAFDPNDRDGVAAGVVKSVSRFCPIDVSDRIDGRRSECGIIRPRFDPFARPEWPETFYLIVHKTEVSYTLEAPSDFELAVRVRTLVEGARVILDGLSGGETRAEP